MDKIDQWIENLRGTIEPILTYTEQLVEEDFNNRDHKNQPMVIVLTDLTLGLTAVLHELDTIKEKKLII